MIETGKTLGHYRVVRMVGAGGMGEVYEAEDLRLGRSVALKLLPREVSTDPQRLRRFITEARALASLNHPNIVTVYAVEGSKQPPVPCIIETRLGTGKYVWTVYHNQDILYSTESAKLVRIVRYFLYNM